MIYSAPDPLVRINSIIYHLTTINPDITTVEAKAVRYIFSASALSYKVFSKLEDIDKTLDRMIDVLYKIQIINSQYRLHTNTIRTLLPHHICDIDKFLLFVQKYKQHFLFGDTPKKMDFNADDFLERFADYLKEIMFVICGPIADKLLSIEAKYMRQCDEIKYAIKNAGPHDNLAMLKDLAKEIQILRVAFLEAEATFVVNMEHVASIVEGRVYAAIVEQDILASEKLQHEL